MHRDTKIAIAQAVAAAVMIPGLVISLIEIGAHGAVVIALGAIAPPLAILLIPNVKDRYEEWRFRRDIMRRRHHG